MNILCQVAKLHKRTFYVGVDHLRQNDENDSVG